MGSQRVGHDLATKQQQSCIYVNPSLPALLILKATLQGNYHHHPHFTDKQRLQEVAQKYTVEEASPSSEALSLTTAPLGLRSDEAETVQRGRRPEEAYPAAAGAPTQESWTRNSRPRFLLLHP